MALRRIVLAFALTMAVPASAFAFAGGGGCSDLPEYYRAVGVLQGIPSACGLSVEEARRIVYGPAAAQQAQPAPRVRHRHHRARTQQP